MVKCFATHICYSCEKKNEGTDKETQASSYIRVTPTKLDEIYNETAIQSSIKRKSIVQKLNFDYSQKIISGNAQLDIEKLLEEDKPRFPQFNQKGEHSFFLYQKSPIQKFNSFVPLSDAFSSGITRVVDSVLPNLPLPSIINNQARRCSCRKSRCLKLYCECFSNKSQCNYACDCQNCMNIEGNKEELDKLIYETETKNPSAFVPKISYHPTDCGNRKKAHNRGCNCKRSACLKKYCECFQSGVSCTSRCQCKSCENTSKYNNKRLYNKILLKRLKNERTTYGKYKTEQ